MPHNDAPRVRLMMGPGTLPSQGKDRMDLTQYSERLSGKPKLTGKQMLQALPEIAQFAHVDVDPGNPHEMSRPDDLRKLALYMNAEIARPDVDGLVWIQGTNSL